MFSEYSLQIVRLSINSFEYEAIRLSIKWPVYCIGCDTELSANGGSMGINKKISYKWLKKEYKASYTIETALVMTVFCLVMVVLIQQAYRLHDETKNGMKLQEGLEKIRHDEDGNGEKIQDEMQEHIGLLLSMEGVDIKLEAGSNKAAGKIWGTENGRKWELEISERIYEPEEFLRKMAALKQLEERYESQIQERNAP